MKKRIDNLKNFGFAGETTVVAPGINAKMNEFQAAMGLIQLKTIDSVIYKRKQIVDLYREGLKDIDGIRFLDNIDHVQHCYSYFPIFIDSIKYGKTRDELYEYLKLNNINGRRYFYPLISQFPTYRGLESAHPNRLPIAEEITQAVICLPLYPNLELNEIEMIISLIKEK
jgi:dTDP-4-amino-4,6-dideoxygalactose transaminase